MSASPVLSGRASVHAGILYPADRDELGALVDDLLDGASARLVGTPSAVVRGALVPHAGLASSGLVAAAGWATVATTHPTTLVLLGTDHADDAADGSGASGVAVWTDGPWVGPLGDVAIDHGLAERVAAFGPPFRVDAGEHAREHSLEIHMPFVTRACPAARIVPLLVGDVESGTARIAGAWLGRLLAALRAGGERVVLVTSADLTHDPRVRSEETDRRMLDAILALDVDGLCDDGPVPRLPGGRPPPLSGGSGIRAPSGTTGVCGLAAVAVTLVAVDEMGASHGRLLAEGTSADRDQPGRRGDTSYAAIAFVC